MFGFIRGGNLVRISCRKKCLMRRVDASRRVASMEVRGQFQRGDREPY